MSDHPPPQSDREQLPLEQEWSEQIVNSSTDFIFAFDTALAVRVWNTLAERVTGVARHQALERPVTSIPALGTIAGPETVFRRALGGESLRLHERPFFIAVFGVEAVFDLLLSPLRGRTGAITGAVGIIHDITRYRRAEALLRASEGRLQEAQRLAHVGSWEWSGATDRITWSDEMYRITGRDPQSLRVDRELSSALIHPADYARAHAALDHVLRTRETTMDELRIVRPDGSVRVVESRVEPELEPDGSVSGLHGTWLDITERKQAEESRAREREFRTLAENTTDAIVRFDRSLRRVYVNPALAAVLGRPRAELLGSGADRELDKLGSEVAKVIATGRPRTLEITRTTPRGERWFDSHLVPELDSRGEVESVLVVDRDITELKHAQQALQQLTLVDPLTGIPNRRYLAQFMQREWRNEARHRHEMALVMIDIDHFKSYNDAYGHQRGDECLRQVATTLKTTLHRPADTPVRYGGEEFAVLLPETGLPAAREIAERLRHAVSDLAIPHARSPVADRITISLGVAALPADRGDFDTLLAHADAALYRAKQQGRNRVENSGGREP